MKWSMVLGGLVLGTASSSAVLAAQATPTGKVLVGQYKRLQDEAPIDLKTYAGKVVLGFPSTSFRQEYSDNTKIADFCKNTYGIKFPMFANMEVVGPNAAPLYKALQQATGQAVRWNFNKYLISKDETRIQYFPSDVPPLGSALEDLVIEELKR